MENKSDDAETAILSLPQPPEKKVSCDPILNTINSNKEMRELARIGNKSNTI